MAKAKYREWISDPDKRALLSGWARRGLSDEQIAKNIGISRSTLAEWKRKYPDISDTIIKSKDVADVNVENSLYEKCIGKKVEIKKTFKIRDVIYENGKKVRETEKLEVGMDEIYIQPDTKAIIFWLTNRRPEDWKEHLNYKDAEEGAEGGVILIGQAEEERIKDEIRKYREEKAKGHMEPAAEAVDHDEQRGG